MAITSVPVAPSDLVAMKEGDSPSKDLCHRDLRGPEAGRYPVQQLLKDSEMKWRHFGFRLRFEIVK